MHTLPGQQSALTARHRVLIFLALVSLGLAANYFKYELFFDINFIFGSVFALLALQILGFGSGIVASALIGSITYPLWHQPYTVIILTAEVITVGLLTRRKGLSLVVADAIFWLCLGMPLVTLFHFQIMQLPLSTVLIIMEKQAINGITNAMAAGMLFMAIATLGRWTQFSFREIIFHLLAVFIFGPSLLILTIDSRIEFHDTDQAIRTALLHASDRTAYNLEQWLQSHLSQISHLAKMATINPPASLQRGIEEIHSGNPDFLRVGITDQSATIVAFSPLTEESGEPIIGHSCADRPFIPTLKLTLQPMLSEVVMDCINNPEPVVSMLAPIVKGGVYDGYAAGFLNLQGLNQVIEIEAKDQGIRDTLLDKNGRVIVTNRQGLQVMERYRREPGYTKLLDDGISQWQPEDQKNISIAARWQKSRYIKETTFGKLAEWTLVLEQPLAPFQQKLFQRFAKKLGLLLSILLMALLLAALFSRKIIQTLTQLNLLTTDLPQKLLAGQDISWPESAIRETSSLLGNFKEMAQAL